MPRAPWQISGRGADGRPLADPAHPHAFWLPEDADEDGWIDHISVYIESGIDDDVRARLDRITRLWLAPTKRPGGRRARARDGEGMAARPWKVSADSADFAGSARIFAAGEAVAERDPVSGRRAPQGITAIGARFSACSSAAAWMWMEWRSRS